MSVAPIHENPDLNTTIGGQDDAACVRRCLVSYSRRKRQLAVIRALGRALAVALLWLIIGCLLDRWLRLSASVRAAALVGGAVLCGWIVGRALARAVFRRADWIAVAADIERRRPEFGQRLLTVVSQSVFSKPHRASIELLEVLIRDVAQQMRALGPAGKLLPFRRAARPWVSAAVVAAAFLALTRISWLAMPTLAMRMLNPLSAIEPVTTTRLNVSPGDFSIIQGQGVTIVADVQRLIGSTVELSVSHDGRSFNTVEMPRAGATSLAPQGFSRYAFAFASLDRDMSYQVGAGDAVSPRFLVRVLHRPSVSEFRINYIYPDYTGKPPNEIINADGFVEAPIGTEIVLSVRTTEPLRDATLRIDESPLKLLVDDDDATLWQAGFVVQRDARYTLDMVSAAGVSGFGPAQMSIRAIPDRPPTLKLALTAEDLRYHPRDVVAIPFVAADDYGLADLRLLAQVNSAPAVDVKIDLPADVRRRHEDVFEFDLSPLKLAIGDVLSFNLVASDQAQQSAQTEMRHALIAPRSIDLNTHLRLGELRYALRLAEMLVTEIQAAQSADAQVRAESQRQPESWMVASARSRLNQHAVTASEASTLLRLTLLRVILRSAGAPMSDALANLLDATQPTATLAEDVARLRDQPQAMEERLAASSTQAGALVGHLRTLFDGQQATVVLADRENLAALPSSSPDADQAQRQVESAARAAQEIARGAAQIGLDPEAADLDEQLRARVATAEQWINQQQPVDYVAAARSAMDAPSWDELDERLGLAAQAEAVRPDANLARARDLQLASRAASAIDHADDQEARLAFGDALTSMHAEHRAQRAAAAHSLATNIEPEIARAADSARVLMAKWAGDRDTARLDSTTSPTDAPRSEDADTAPATPPSAQELAMAASAEAAGRNYERAAELDRRLASRRSSIQGEEEWENQLRVQRAMSAAKQIDELNAEQEKIRDAVSQAPADELPAIAQRQGDLATTIRQVREEQSELRGESAAKAQAERAAAGIAALSDLGRQLDAMLAHLPSVRQAAEPLSSMLAAQQSALAAHQQAMEIHAQAVAAHEAAKSQHQQMQAAHEQAVAARELAASAQAQAQQAISAAQAQLAAAMAAPAATSAPTTAATQPFTIDPALEQAVETARQALAQADATLKNQTSNAQAAATQLAAAESALSTVGAQVESALAATAVAEQAANAAATALDAARASAVDAAKGVHPDVAAAMAQSIRALTAMPVETLIETIEQQLAPSLNRLQQALSSADSAAANASVDQAAPGVEAARKKVDEALSAIIDRQPLPAAEHFANAAQQSIAAGHDRAVVVGQQQRASEALLLAWDRAIRRASTERLKGLSVMGSLFSLYEGGEGAAGDAASAAGAPSARQWGLLSRRQDIDLNASWRDDAPAGYHDAIRAYFESLAGNGPSAVESNSP